MKAIVSQKDAPRRAGRKSRVFVVDDHPIVQQGLSLLINQQADLEVCGSAEDASTALEIAGTLKPDCVLVDISLKGMDGIDLIKQLVSRWPALPVLVFSMHDESLYAARALRAGGRGYVMKQEGTESLLSALRRVLKGKIVLSEEMENRVLQEAASGRPWKSASPIDRLSDRELEVFSLIGQGQSTRQIAEALCVSVKTIESYRAQIKQKLVLKTSPQLVQHAVQWAALQQKI